MKLAEVRTSGEDFRTIVVAPSEEGGRFLLDDTYETEFIAQTLELRGATEEEAELCSRALAANASVDDEEAAKSFLERVLTMNPATSTITSHLNATDERWIAVCNASSSRGGAYEQHTLHATHEVRELMPYVPQAVGAVALS